MVKAKGKNCTTKHNMHSETRNSILHRFLTDVEYREYQISTHGWTKQSHCRRCLPRCIFGRKTTAFKTLDLLKTSGESTTWEQRYDMQDMKKELSKIWDVARQDPQYQKHFPPERRQRERQRLSASAEDSPEQAKHRETCCRTQTQPWFFELKLLVAAVAHFADVATAMRVVVIRPKMDMEFVATCLYHCF